MSITLQYLNMPKRRKQNKQNRKLIQEQMNRQKELKKLEEAKAKAKANDTTYCVIC